MKPTLAEVILNQKVKGYINHVNTHGFRTFDERTDDVRFSLTVRQFAVIEKTFKIKHYHEIGVGVRYEKFYFDGFTFHIIYNDRMGIYELRGYSTFYIENDEERFEILDTL